MDPVSTVFYAVVCGGLAAMAPSFQSRAARLVVGTVTGIIAATLLPLLRRAFGI
ncbi:hypothetical protein N7E70_019495 [Aminobacter sp. NyZ550]|jgi:hypothetical protein|uniref:Uncharacterized protein n=2 Tax=Aminobacter TaxID=31988 RepID=A0AAC8YQV1_AMIAI|nr:MULTISPECIES: hypothetical protein [Aminobacter]AMS42860.1 hypothetical protein AA2016_3942 [Aminobacter aminovorans]MBA8905885.1 hypothetical protein [Aminobacter ciceronei]MBA9019664.1 hypothetical protein [Aminobacter ciceronei]MBB3704709.1 hypothetical protein [Aminobacter aminovorans]MRX34188.1 hypothetical protein [Aminobacter sp. MDW-2]